jgi:hypothetical protein
MVPNRIRNNKVHRHLLIKVCVCVCVARACVLPKKIPRICCCCAVRTEGCLGNVLNSSRTSLGVWGRYGRTQYILDDFKGRLW